MKLLEYEAKQILRGYDVPVPASKYLEKETRVEITLPAVLKSQVPVGGRGKLGGILVIEQAADIIPSVERLFALDIKGFRPHTILAEEKLAIQDEHYFALLIDRDQACTRLVAHTKGGVEVEDNSSDDFFSSKIDISTLQPVSKALADYLHYDVPIIAPLVSRLYEAFVESDATLLEINPLVYTDAGTLVCGDCKMELDDAAAFRHPQWQFEQTISDTNFVTLNRSGSVATIANGAGLAMATVDAVAASDMTPANFLDIGGGATSASVLAAFEQIQTFPDIQAIVINIFAGITRCDQIARAVIEAKKSMGSLPPLFIRLAGTNFEEAVTLLSAEDIPTLGTLEDCLRAAKGVVRG